MLFKLMPGLKKLIQYDRSNLSGDITSGMITAFLLIPQSIAYAIIVGVPPTMGLFAGTYPLIVYAVFGSSNYLSIGPVSIISLLTFSGISGIVPPNTFHFFQLVILLTLIIGVVQLLLGVIRFGSFFDYISPAIISGFISAAAIIIALNQVTSITGISLTNYQNIISYTYSLIQRLPSANPYTVGVGIGSLLLLLIIKKKFLTGPFLVIITSIIIVDYFDLNKRGVEIVGEIPQKVMGTFLQIPTSNTLITLFPIALMIGFISFFESYAIAKTLAAKENDQLNPNQELFGLGLANITSSIVGGIPVAGGISRTAVTHQSGAKSNLSLVITALFVLLATLYFTPLFYYLPKATLAAIIIIAVSNLINVKHILYYAKNSPSDALILLVTFTATLTIDIFTGLIIGIFLSLLINLMKRKIFAI